MGSQHLFGDLRYGTTGTMIVQELTAGSHVFTPEYRQPGTGSEFNNFRCLQPSSFFLALAIHGQDAGDWTGRTSQVIQLPPGTVILRSLAPTNTWSGVSNNAWQVMNGK
jgi:hypothetical protein